MKSTLFFLLTSTILGSLLAQYQYPYGCTRQVTLPGTYAVPSYQTQCQCCYQTPRVGVVPYNYCQAPYMHQNIVPPPCPVYQPTPIIVPLPPPPKDCCSAHTTVTTPTPCPSNLTHPAPAHHPPICVQTVYVAKDDEEEKEEKKKCDCKKKKKDDDHEDEHEHDDRYEGQQQSGDSGLSLGHPYGPHHPAPNSHPSYPSIPGLSDADSKRLLPNLATNPGQNQPVIVQTVCVGKKEKETEEEKGEKDKGKESSQKKKEPKKKCSEEVEDEDEGKCYRKKKRRRGRKHRRRYYPEYLDPYDPDGYDELCGLCNTGNTAPSIYYERV